MTLADGGAIGDWTLAADWFVAVGTIGAVSLALVLAGSDRRATVRSQRDTRQRQTRQVVGVFIPGNPVEPRERVEAFNGSGEVISRVLFQVRLQRNETSADVQQGSFVWEWDDPDSNGLPTIPYLAAGERVALTGSFWPSDGSGHADHTRQSAPTDQGKVTVSIAWQDSHGDVWFRLRDEPAFPTTWTYPGRDIRGPVPREHWPDYWPGSEQPMTLRQRVRRARFRRAERRRPWNDPGRW
jgi:hypothetical protein